MNGELRWTEPAVNQLGAIAEYIALVSPVYAEQTIDRIVARLRQAQEFPESGRRVAEAPTLDLRELIEPPLMRLHANDRCSRQSVFGLRVASPRARI